MRSRLLYLWYAAIAILLLTAVAYVLAGQAAEFVKRSRWEAFSRQAAVWQPVVNEPYADFINRFAKQHSVNAKLVAAVIQAESSFEPQAVSKSGAYGLMQIIPGTWKQVNDKLSICQGRHTGECTPVCYREPELNIHIGTAYLSQLIKYYNGNYVLALAAYNAGPGAVDRSGGIPAFQETQEYVERVVANWEKRQSGAEKNSITPKINWSIVHRYAGWMLLLSLLFLFVVIGGLYRHYGSWRWR